MVWRLHCRPRQEVPGTARAVFVFLVRGHFLPLWGGGCHVRPGADPFPRLPWQPGQWGSPIFLSGASPPPHFCAVLEVYLPSFSPWFVPFWLAMISLSMSLPPCSTDAPLFEPQFCHLPRNSVLVDTHVNEMRGLWNGGGGVAWILDSRLLLKQRNAPRKEVIFQNPLYNPTPNPNPSPSPATPPGRSTIYFFWPLFLSFNNPFLWGGLGLIQPGRSQSGGWEILTKRFFRKAWTNMEVALKKNVSGLGVGSCWEFAVSGTYLNEGWRGGFLSGKHHCKRR